MAVFVCMNVVGPTAKVRPRTRSSIDGSPKRIVVATGLASETPSFTAQWMERTASKV